MRGLAAAVNIKDRYRKKFGAGFFRHFALGKAGKFRKNLPLKKSGKFCYNYTITGAKFGNTEHMRR